MPLYLGKGLVSQKVNLIKGDSSASSGDEIKCLNETGKAVSEGDKVWINSASQVSVDTVTGLKANSYNAYSNKESTLTGYVKTGGDVNEEITVKTILPPKINQSISVNADNATIEVEL